MIKKFTLTAFLFISLIVQAKNINWDFNIDIETRGNSYITGIEFDKQFGIYGIVHFDDRLIFGTDTLTNKIGEEDIAIVKYNILGQYQWVRHFENNSNYLTGKGDLCIDNVNAIYFACNYSDSLGYNDVQFKASENGKGGIVAKFNNSGDALWLKEISSAGIISDLQCEYADEQLYLGCGFTESLQIDTVAIEGLPNYYSNAFVCATDTALKVKWRHAYTLNTMFPMPTFNTVKVNNEGKLLLAGTVSVNVDFGNNVSITNAFDNVFVTQFNKNGIAQWANVSLGYGQLNNMSVGNNNSIFLTGMFLNDIGFGIHSVTSPIADHDAEIFLAKLNNEGEAQYVKGFGSVHTGYDAGLAYVDGLLDYGFLISEFGDTLTMGSDSVFAVKKPSNNSLSYNLAVSMHNGNGEPVWLTYLGLEGDGHFGDIKIANDKLFFAGHILGGLSAKSAMVVENKNAVISAVDVESLETLRAYNVNAESLQVYPNPVKNTFTVVLPNFADNSEEILLITNIEGRLAKTIITQSAVQDIDIQELPSGIYFIKTRNSAPIKLVKQ